MEYDTEDKQCRMCERKQPTRFQIHDDGTRSQISACSYCGYKPGVYGREFGIRVEAKGSTMIFRSAGTRRRSL